MSKGPRALWEKYKEPLTEATYSNYTNIALFYTLCSATILTLITIMIFFFFFATDNSLIL